LIILKKEIEVDTRRAIKLTITGASEAHLIATEIAEAGVGVILTPPIPMLWEDRRM
jgi:hypothetical protein